jgi:hypothetical protein
MCTFVRSSERIIQKNQREQCLVNIHIRSGKVSIPDSIARLEKLIIYIPLDSVLRKVLFLWSVKISARLITLLEALEKS